MEQYQANDFEGLQWISAKSSSFNPIVCFQIQDDTISSHKDR